MSDYYKVRALKKNVYRIGSREGVHSDLFIGRDKALLWDTGYGFGQLHDTVKALTGDKPLYIVNSHGHVDHTCGNAQFTEDIFIHEADMALCRAHTGEAERKKSVRLAKVHEDAVTHEITDILPDDFDEEAYIRRGSGRLVPVAEGHIFDLGGITLEVREVPGHTKGSIALIYKEMGWLYAGDAMNLFFWLFAEEAQPLSVYIDTLYKAKTFNCSKLIISHNPPPFPIEILDDFLDCALNIRYEEGGDFHTPIFPESPGRVCMKGGYDENKIGIVPAIVISKSKF